MNTRQKTPIDSNKWCRYLIRIGYIAVVINALVHLAWLIAARDVLGYTREYYLWYYILVPTIVLLFLKITIHLLFRSPRIPIAAKEYLCSFSTVMFLSYIILTHVSATVLITAFLLSIFASAIFAKINIVRAVSITSIIVVLLFGVKMYLTGRLDRDIVMQIIVTVVLFYFAYLLAKILIQHYQDNLEAIMFKQEEATKNELAFLQAQIKPHFLYNAINTMVSFCYTDSERAAALLVNFSQYLRLVFDVDHQSMVVPLKREIELIKAYVEIEKARFGELINVEYDIDPELLRMEIPSFCIQPLVENAIKHGLCKKSGGGTVLISAKKTEGSIIINVSDTGVGMSPKWLDKLRNIESAKVGVGFFNVSRRIKSWKDARLDIQSTEGEGTAVTIAVLDAIA